MMQTGKVIEFLGLNMHAWTMRETLACVTQRIESGQATRHCVLNVAKLVHAKRNMALRNSVEACDIVNIDGMGLVWGARLYGRVVPERVTGIDLMEELLNLAAVRHWRIYVLGAAPDVLARGAEHVREKWPGIEIAGFHHGYFRNDQSQDIVDTIAASDVDILFVAMSSPGKERFIERWGEQTGAKFIMGVGGAVDILAGKTRRAPRWMRSVGLEWLFRVLQEPRRMAPRYAKTNVMFLLYLLSEFPRRTQL